MYSRLYSPVVAHTLQLPHCRQKVIRTKLQSSSASCGYRLIMSHGTDKTQSSIPEWARVCPPDAGAAPAGAAPVELTAGRAAMSNVSEQLGAEEGDAARVPALVLATRDPMAENQDHIVNAEHNARVDSSAPEAVLQKARTLRLSICADAEGGLNAHQFHIQKLDARSESDVELEDEAPVGSVDAASAFVCFCDMCSKEVSLVISRGKRNLPNLKARHL